MLRLSSQALPRGVGNVLSLAEGDVGKVYKWRPERIFQVIPKKSLRPMAQNLLIN
jgi:hypothetical protein